MRTDEEIGEGFVLVPGGPFEYGEGDAAEIREVGDFAIARYPVTFGEYAEFLDSLQECDLQERLPRTFTDGPLVERGADGLLRPCGKLADTEPHHAEQGRAHFSRVPVVGVTWDDAVAYCVWRTRGTGRKWRLPTEEEWEKAARGVDGRRVPWGDLVDASLAMCRDSRKEASELQQVGAFPTASSVYGMCDAVGNVLHWTDSWGDARRSGRVLRGGSWCRGAADLQLRFRIWGSPDVRLADVGFRCARSF